MGRIFKYEMRRRLNIILILGGVMKVLAIGAIILMLFDKTGSNFSYDKSNGSPVFWWHMITFFACTFIPMVMFFMCSNGHVEELLYKDTNYLMLTIPIKSQSILAGRILAGFTEYIIYAAISLVFFILFAAIQSAQFSPNDTVTFMSALSLILKNIFVYNALPVLYMLLLVISSFLLVGTVFIFVKALTRSFIRRKNLAHFIAIILFILVMSQIIKLGANLSIRWELVQYIDVNFIWNETTSPLRLQAMPIYLVSIIMTFLLSGVFFVASSWLIENQVEL